MKNYIFSVAEENFNNAYSKARNDIETIAVQMGFEPVQYLSNMTAYGSLSKQFQMGVDCIRCWKRFIELAEEASTVLVQYPVFPIKTAYLLSYLIPWAKRKKKLRFAALIHDLNSLRGYYGSTAVFSDSILLRQFDDVICHNSSMKDYLLAKGGNYRIIELDMFDYLTSSKPRNHAINEGIAIAGNLAPEKSGYIYKLSSLNGCKLHLYGDGLQKQLSNAVYHGAIKPEDLPGIIEGGFGLIWDGSDLNQCSGKTGQYLIYNNPHKLSLYVASGMPVMIWKNAAAARYVLNNEIGIVIDSLNNINQIIQNVDEKDYQTMHVNVKRIRNKLINGEYTRNALMFL